MSYAQWNQYTQYVVGDRVLSAGVPYRCIVAVGPSATLPASDPTKWASLVLPSGGVAYSALNWTLDATNGFYYADITGISPFLSTSSRILATVQMFFGYTNAQVAIASQARLIAVYATDANGGTIRFFVSSAGGSLTQQYKTYISWSVFAF